MLRTVERMVGWFRRRRVPADDSFTVCLRGPAAAWGGDGSRLPAALARLDARAAASSSALWCVRPGLMLPPDTDPVSGARLCELFDETPDAPSLARWAQMGGSEWVSAEVSWDAAARRMVVAFDYGPGKVYTSEAEAVAEPWDRIAGAVVAASPHRGLCPAAALFSLDDPVLVAAYAELSGALCAAGDFREAWPPWSALGFLCALRVDGAETVRAAARIVSTVGVRLVGPDALADLARACPPGLPAAAAAAAASLMAASGLPAPEAVAAAAATLA